MGLINALNASTQIAAYMAILGFIVFAVLLFAVFNARGYFRSRQFLFALLFSHVAFIIAVSLLASRCGYYLWGIALTIDFVLFPIMAFCSSNLSPIKELFFSSNLGLALTIYFVGGSLQWYIIGTILDYLWKLFRIEQTLSAISVRSSTGKIFLLILVVIILLSVGKLGFFLIEWNKPIQKVPLTAQELKRAALLNKFQELEGRLFSSDPVVQEQAVEEVKRLSIADARTVVHDLIARINWQSKENPQIRSVLAKIGGPAVQEAIQEQIDLLGSGRREKWRPVSVLGELGPLAKTATPALVNLAFYGDSEAVDHDDVAGRNAKYALAKIESISDRAAFGIDVDTTVYTVKFPIDTGVDLGKQYWVYLGAGNVITGILKSKNRADADDLTGVSTYGFLSIPEDEHKTFATYAKGIALVSDLKPVASPIEKYLFTELNYTPPASVIQKINPIIDEQIRPYVDGEFVDKKTAFARYGIGKNAILLRANIEYSYDKDNSLLASFDFIANADKVNLARVVHEPSRVNKNDDNPGETVRFSINDLGFYDNIFDFDSDGAADLAENISGYESFATVLYKVINSSSTSLLVPTLTWGGGL